MENLFSFPSPFIFKFSIKNHEQIKHEFLPKILLLKEKNQSNPDYKWSSDTPSNMITNFNQPPENIFNDLFFNSVIWNPINFLYKNFDLYKNTEPDRSTINRIWWNVYEYGDYAEHHSHGNQRLCGIYLLKLEELNKTVFTHNSFCGFVTKRTLDAKEGDVLLFPSELEHYVLPAERQRVTISFDISTIFNRSKTPEDANV